MECPVKSFRELRLNAGLSVIEVAIKIKRSRICIENMEAGKRVPKIDEAELLAETYGVTLNEILAASKQNQKINEEKNVPKK